MADFSEQIQIVDATPERWAGFEQLLGSERGGSGGCWCMLWRLQKKDYDILSRSDRREAMRGRFGADTPPGLLAYAGETADRLVLSGAARGIPAIGDVTYSQAG